MCEIVPNTDPLKGFGCLGGGKYAGGLCLSFGCFLALFSYLIVLSPSSFGDFGSLSRASVRLGNGRAPEVCPRTPSGESATWVEEGEQRSAAPQRAVPAQHSHPFPSLGTWHVPGEPRASLHGLKHLGAQRGRRRWRGRGETPKGAGRTSVISGVAVWLWGPGFPTRPRCAVPRPPVRRWSRRDCSSTELSSSSSHS